MSKESHNTRLSLEAAPGRIRQGEDMIESFQSQVGERIGNSMWQLCSEQSLYEGKE